MKNDFLENRRQAQLNKVRGQGHAAEVRSLFSIFLIFETIFRREQLQLSIPISVG